MPMAPAGVAAGKDPDEFICPLDEVPNPAPVYFDVVCAYGDALLHHNHPQNRAEPAKGKQRHSSAESHAGRATPVKCATKFTLNEDVEPFPGLPNLCSEFGIRPKDYPGEPL